MKLKKCFVEVFDAPLKEHGFKRKDALFYRMNGNVLQGIYLKSMYGGREYEIYFSYFPYWVYNFVGSIPVRFQNLVKISKGYWAENGCHIPAPSYDEENDIGSLSDMEVCLKAILEEALPHMDKIVDEETCLNAEFDAKFRKIPYYSPSLHPEDPFVEAHPVGFVIPKEQLLLWLAYKDGSFSRTNELLEKHLERVEEWNELGKAHGNSPVNIDRYLHLHFQNYIDNRNENDLLWIKQVYDRESLIMRERLQKELKLIL